MFYAFSSWFDLNLFSYVTVRAAIAFFVAFLLTLVLMPKYIRWAIAKKANQPISKFAPKNHQQKSNIPTMGGLVFLVATLVALCLCANLNNGYVIVGVVCILLFGLIGIKDDLSKVLHKSNVGMSARVKFGLQCASGLVVALCLYGIGFEKSFYVPFYKNALWDWDLFAILFWTLVFVATSNAVNITDGLDGLVAIPSIYALTSLGVFVYVAGNSVLSSYLLWPKVSGSSEVAIIGAAFVGSLIGFLWYNCHPAQVFMGDSGSLAIGGFIAYMAILSKNEILLFLIGFIFVIEALSVIVQIGSYKTRGKKIFLMAPLHHHFEEKGLSESKIIVRFWIIALLSNLVALLTLKLR